MRRGADPGSAGAAPVIRRAALHLSAAEARRAVLGAQGFTDPPPTGRVDRRHLRRVLGRIGLLQLDSVQAVVRSHELPVFSRLGPYPRDVLRTMAAPGGELFEYWGHEASLLPVAWHPLVRWRMARAAQGEMWAGLARFAREHPAVVEDVLALVAERGPTRAGEVTLGRGRRGPWWGWSDGKRALEWLFWCGRLTAYRRPSFERVYDLPERVLPEAVLRAPTPSEEEAHRTLLARAAGALGVGTVADLADWFRLDRRTARVRLAELVEDDRLVTVAVEGWREPAYAPPDLRLPRRPAVTTLVSPFDSLVWERRRTERLFGFRYRLEFYVPAERRQYGYYVMPLLHDGRLEARLDVRADRRAGRLELPGAWAEPHLEGPARARVAAAAAGAARRLADWLELDGVAVGERGDLAGEVAAALGSAHSA